MSPSVYLARHAQAFLASLGRMARSLFATLLTVLVIALALALPLALQLFVTNAAAATGGFAEAVDMSVYFKTGVPLEKVQQLARNARANRAIADVTVISADQALQEFRQYSGFGAALKSLQDNPLPHVLHVHPVADASSSAALESLRRYFTAWPEVDVVQMDADWVLRFNAILEVLRRVLAIAAMLLAAGVLAVIGNTIRLEILNRRSEIEVTKLVGGTNAFVRRPFLYTGALYGLAGALTAWAVVAVVVRVLDTPVATLAHLYGSHFSLSGPTPPEIAILIGGGAALGWLGAWISAARHLHAIEPRA